MADDDRETELEDGRMPLLDHLIELRNRLMWSIGAVLVAFLVCYQFKERLYGFLVHPLAVIFEGQTGRHLIYTGLTEAFFTYVKVSFWAGLCVAFPIIASQIWKFVAPGLYKNERRAFYPYLFATPVLFAMGAALAYFVVIPVAWRFFVSFETPAATDGGLPIVLEAMRVSAEHLASEVFLAAPLRSAGPLFHGVRKAKSYMVEVAADFVIDDCPGRPGVVLLSACSGHGFKFTITTGAYAAALALGSDMPHRDRFRLRLPSRT